MWHILPIRGLLIFFAAMIGVTVFTTLYFEGVPLSGIVDAAVNATKFITPASVAILILPLAIWRWVPLVQSAFFPYLGGFWRGELTFIDDTGLIQSRDITLHVKHTLYRIVLLLESKESVSKTLSVHVRQDKEFNHHELHYIYQNRRRNNVSGPGISYHGLAMLNIALDSRRMTGTYFTESGKKGSIDVSFVKASPWWKLWR
jgi:hypothetical protein